MTVSYVVQILVPKKTGKAEPVSKEWFDEFLQKMTDEFGGATSYIRTAAQGLWRNGDDTERDDIAVVELMTAKIAPEFWRSLRERLERELSQDEIIIRAQEIIPL